MDQFFLLLLFSLFLSCRFFIAYTFFLGSVCVYKHLVLFHLTTKTIALAIPFALSEFVAA